MDRRELAWRSRAAARIAFDRAKMSLRPSCWDRADLAGAIASTPELRPLRRALAARDWNAAHLAIGESVVAAPVRFPIAPSMRLWLGERIAGAHPPSVAAAAARANKAIDGHYDLLGYTDLRFGEGASVDWQFDPVHGRRPPREFWSDVPFLSPESGDHKIIWELNRHQHWLALGRAYWLTGDCRYKRTALAQLASWLDTNPPLVGVNWSSMLELAFRSISWVWALNFFAEPQSADAPWSVDLLLALDRQLEHIEQHLSYYFSPNTHLLGEALALYVGGVALPQLAASRRRSVLGRRILVEEIARQIGADGGHCERSAHYHRYALDFYLMALVVARLTDDPATTSFSVAVSRLAEAARLLADDAGRLPHFGDDDGGAAFPIAGRALDDVTDSLEVASVLVGRPELRVGEPTEEAMWLLGDQRFAQGLNALRRLSPSEAPASAHLADTGYCVSRTEGGAHLVLDAGPHGFQNAGHAHADALSLTLTVRNRPLLIDPGTHCYTVEPRLRDRMRSTALHNTLTLDGRSASVPAGPFSWAHSANGHVRRWRKNRRFDYVDASHDGYAPLEHRRRVFVLHHDLIVVADVIRGGGTRRADAHWHLDPRWAVDVDGGSATATLQDEEVQMVFPLGNVERFVADSETGLGWHAPVYGRLEPATTLRITQIATAPLWVLSVFGLCRRNRIENVDVVPVWSAAGVLDHSMALRITRASTVDEVVFAEPRDPKDASTWRTANLETNAVMLFCRTPKDGDARPEVALVDGSRVRSMGRREFAVERTSAAADLYIDSETLSNTNRERLHVRDCGIR
jgi:uncharacterized heparinase superfamily protein